MAAKLKRVLTGSTENYRIFRYVHLERYGKNVLLTISPQQDRCPNQTSMQAVFIDRERLIKALQELLDNLPLEPGESGI